ncbi:MAG: YCF48-related protein, partial [Saprospiraceae bacterium]|nr:YCF48-related protein [Saprospiraceae bacterium]
MKKELIPLLVYRFIALFLFACTFNLSADSYPITFKSFEEDLQVTAVCNSQLTIALDDVGQYTLDPTEVDNGSSSDQGPVSLSLDITEFDCNDIGTPVLVTLTVMEDATGTTDNCTSTITVIDDLAPADVCENQTIDVGDGMTQSMSPVDFLSAPMDNCSPTVNAVFLDPFSGWIEEASASSANLQDVFFADANNGWIVGNLGSIQHTIDGGTTWVAQTSGVTEELQSVYFADVNTGWAVGLNKTILKTSDGGTTWSVINPMLVLGSDFYSVFFLDLNNGYITGSGGVLLNTTDGGNTWVDQGVTLLVNKRDIFFTDANNGWIISQDSILHTNDGGVIWNVQDPIVSNILRKLSFVDASNGWIVGDNGIILNTTDGGTTW